MVRLLLRCVRTGRCVFPNPNPWWDQSKNGREMADLLGSGVLNSTTGYELRSILILVIVQRTGHTIVLFSNNDPLLTRSHKRHEQFK